MRVLVTGAKGMLGREVCRVYSSKHEVIGVDQEDFDIVDMQIESADICRYINGNDRLNQLSCHAARFLPGVGSTVAYEYPIIRGLSHLPRPQLVQSITQRRAIRFDRDALVGEGTAEEMSSNFGMVFQVPEVRC